MTQTVRVDELTRVAAPIIDPATLLPLETLALLAQLRDEADGYVTSLVREARRNEVTWAAIGKALGLKPTTAQKRYSLLMGRRS